MTVAAQNPHNTGRRPSDVWFDRTLAYLIGTMLAASIGVLIWVLVWGDR
jgi:hypothetical protein